MKVYKLLSSRNTDIFHHLEGFTEALKLFLFAFCQGTPGDKPMYLLCLCFPEGQIAVVLPRKPLQQLPCHLSEQASTGHTSAALTHQPPPRAPVTAAPSEHLEAFTVSPLSSQGQKSL